MKRLLVTLLALSACPRVQSTGDAGSPEALVDAGEPTPDAGSDAGLVMPDGGPGPFQLVLGPDVWTTPGTPVAFDASASTGVFEFEWNFADGAPPLRSRQPVVTHTFRQPGRYRVVVRAFDRQRRARSALQLVAVTNPVQPGPGSSSTIVEVDGGVAVVVTDADLVTQIVMSDGGFVALRSPTCDEPVGVSALGAELAVACRSGRVMKGTAELFDFGPAAAPVAIAHTQTQLAVALAGTSEVALSPWPGPPSFTRRPAADPRALAVTSAGDLLVSRFRSIADGGLVTWLADGGPTETWLGIDPQPSSDTEIGGIPNLLSGLAISPDGRLAVVSSLQANITEGLWRTGKALTFETSIRAITSFIDVPTRTEQFDRRKQWDNRGAAGAVAFSPRGDFLYVAMPANGLIERYDVLDDAPAGTIFNVGADLRGLAVSADGRFLFVDAALSREVVIFDVSSMRDVPTMPVARVSTIEAEPLSPQLLLGKRLFHDASDPRLTRDGYIACAHCHPDGDEDGIVWDFTDRGEGLRNTLSLLGRRGAGDGPIHWSGNFDEVQDFEGDIRNAFAGAGLLNAADWAATSDALGAPKAGRSADLDALAAYVTSISSPPPSASRTADGGLSDAALRGKALFERADLECAVCHPAPRFTDSRFVDAGVPLLHDVGTLTAASGQRRHGVLSGLDTPSLVGAWRSPPFLHDGSATTLRQVLTTKNATNRHGHTTTLTPQELDDLEAFLRAL